MLLACDFNQDKIPPLTGACSHGLPTLHHRLFPLSPHLKMLPLCFAGSAPSSACVIQLGGGVLGLVLLALCFPGPRSWCNCRLVYWSRGWSACVLDLIWWGSGPLARCKGDSSAWIFIASCWPCPFTCQWLPVWYFLDESSVVGLLRCFFLAPIWWWPVTTKGKQRGQIEQKRERNFAGYF